MAEGRKAENREQVKSQKSEVKNQIDVRDGRLLAIGNRNMLREIRGIRG
ncbi:hypothetical protein JOD20_003613 [Herpetosiphon giganteus]|nr:hypothetical protein [Herpetosiphon giganteus]